MVFIDELDAVGRQRGLIGGSGGQERDATLNQVLSTDDSLQKPQLRINWQYLAEVAVTLKLQEKVALLEG